MKRSLQVSAPLVAATALALLSGCRKPEMQRCVDENNRVVDPSLCRNLPQTQQQNYGSGGGMMFFPYHYYYGGGGGWDVGSPVYGGSYVPYSGHSYTTSSSAAHSTSSSTSSTTRGGFGSSHGGSGSGGGSGGE